MCVKERWEREEEDYSSHSGEISITSTTNTMNTVHCRKIESCNQKWLWKIRLKTDWERERWRNSAVEESVSRSENHKQKKHQNWHWGFPVYCGETRAPGRPAKRDADWIYPIPASVIPSCAFKKQEQNQAPPPMTSGARTRCLCEQVTRHWMTCGSISLCCVTFRCPYCCCCSLNQFA